MTAESSFGGVLGARPGCQREPLDPQYLSGGDWAARLHRRDADLRDQHSLCARVFLAGRQQDLVAQKGKTSSFGIDFTPCGVRGFAQATYWKRSTRRDHGAAGCVRHRAPDLNSLLQLFPGGVTPAILRHGGSAADIPLPATVYFIYSFQQRNAFNLDADGIDADFCYRFDDGNRQLNLDLAVSRKLRWTRVRYGRRNVQRAEYDRYQHDVPVERHRRAFTVGWRRNCLSADLFVNYTGPTSIGTARRRSL